MFLSSDKGGTPLYILGMIPGIAICLGEKKVKHLKIETSTVKNLATRGALSSRAMSG